MGSGRSRSRKNFCSIFSLKELPSRARVMPPAILVRISLAPGERTMETGVPFQEAVATSFNANT